MSSKRMRVGDKTSLSAVAMEETNVVEDLTGNLSSDVSDLTETSRSLRRSARGRAKTSLGVRGEDVDPDQDITKPTNRSVTVNMTDIQLSDDSGSGDETVNVLRKKGGRVKKPYFTGDEFNLTMTRGKANKSLAVRDEAVSNTLAQLDLTDDDSLNNRHGEDEKKKRDFGEEQG